ncbi:MAG: bifunctional phosphopantothenoylcysteine decarboxylase/phosphopantothenate--cysteine ligase CoaBC, partial [Bacteroidota bacterium]
KSAFLVRLIRQAGAEVQVLMTPDATRFITPLTLGTLSGRSVLIDVFPESEEGGWTRHIHLGQWADLLVVAPATAQTIAKMAHGNCDSMLTATVLAARCPILVCPAMDHDMYIHPATTRNIARLREDGHHLLEPEYGELASGLIGQGRLPEPEAILSKIIGLLSPTRDLEGKRVLISAGPTREAIDPVRYVSNHSSGKMGYALAEEARSRGASVTLVAGPTDLADPPGVDVEHIVTADEMKTAILKNSDTSDIIIMAAAVADYTPSEPADLKIKKTGEELSIRMTRTDDILKILGARRRERQILVGFALETNRPLEYAREKLRKKNCDAIVLNSPLDEGAGFGTDTNKVTILTRGGGEYELPLMSKRDVAHAIFDTIILSA